MEVSFFKRRKILKKSNYLHLIPLRKMEFITSDEGKVDVLLPRFKSPYWRNFFRKSKKGEYIRIHLDETGSVIWHLIDGESTVGKICLQTWEQHPSKFKSFEEVQTRVTKFFTLLYDQRYISFREIMKPEQ